MKISELTEQAKRESVNPKVIGIIVKSKNRGVGLLCDEDYLSNLKFLLNKNLPLGEGSNPQ